VLLFSSSSLAAVALIVRFSRLSPVFNFDPNASEEDKEEEEEEEEEEEDVIVRCSDDDDEFLPTIALEFLCKVNAVQRALDRYSSCHSTL